MVKHLISAKLNSEATPTAITNSVTATSTIWRSGTFNIK